MLVVGELNMLGVVHNPSTKDWVVHPIQTITTCNWSPVTSVSLTSPTRTLSTLCRSSSLPSWRRLFTATNGWNLQESVIVQRVQLPYSLVCFYLGKGCSQLSGRQAKSEKLVSCLSSDLHIIEITVALSDQPSLRITISRMIIITKVGAWDSAKYLG